MIKANLTLDELKQDHLNLKRDITTLIQQFYDKTELIPNIHVDYVFEFGAFGKAGRLIKLDVVSSIEVN